MPVVELQDQPVRLIWRAATLIQAEHEHAAMRRAEESTQ